MIVVRNTQRKLKINTEHLKRDAQRILEILDYPDFDLGILITNNKTIHAYNHIYRDKNKPTDVLSFPYHTGLKAGERIVVQDEEDKNLGDIIFSAEYIAQDAPQHGMNFDERLKYLLVHSICHLLGYDHITDSDYKKMRAKERAILKKLSQ